MRKPPPPELSRIVEVTKLNLPIQFSATPEECKAVAKRLGIISLAKLEASLVLRRIRSEQVLEVKGEMKASLAQACVVTLDPVAEEVNETIEAHFSESATHATAEDIEVEAGGPDAPEPIENGKIDLGELVVQHLALALNPYPRKPGAEFGSMEIG